MAGSLIARLDKSLSSRVPAMQADHKARQRRIQDDKRAVYTALGWREWADNRRRATDKLFAEHEHGQFEVRPGDTDKSAFMRWMIGAMGGDPESFPLVTTPDGCMWVLGVVDRELPPNPELLLNELGRVAALVKAYAGQA